MALKGLFYILFKFYYSYTRYNYRGSNVRGSKVGASKTAY